MELGWLCIIFPFLGAFLALVFNKNHPRLRNFVAVFFPFLSAGSSLMLLPYLFHLELLPIESSVEWLSVPFVIEIGIYIDPLSIILVNVVAVISFIITVYCLGYMKNDPNVTRFWTLVNLFIGSMLLLVLSNNLLFLFVGWKLVGLCSYALIGYYYRDEKKYWIGGPPPTKMVSPTFCGLKALVVTGVGDFIMLGGILIIFFYAQTLNLPELIKTSPVWIPKMAETPGMIILVSFLLLAGPIGKSAQFPFHEWLPEAMAGPGPVSALIHAATMVKSGVYLVARLIPIFYYGYWVAGVDEAASFFLITAWVGVITAFVAATQGMVALELKKALAYSTVSQIGYMWIGLGVAGLSQSVLVSGMAAGIFHLVSHAVFKACLFLCAGSVIHGAQSIYMNEMGSMKKYMPRTWVFMLISALCLMGLPPLAGFWSKDAILLSSLEAHAFPIFIIAMITVTLTSFYTTRFIGMVFFGPTSSHIKQIQQKNGNPHEAERSMWGACGVLAVIIVLLGLVGPNVAHLFESVFQSDLVGTLNLPVLNAEVQPFNYHLTVTFLSVLSILIGGVPAYFLYISRKKDPGALLETFSGLKMLYLFFWHRWFIDGFYNKLFIDGAQKSADFVAHTLEDRFDHLVHRKLPHVVTQRIHDVLIHFRTESTLLSDNIIYIFIIFIGLVLMILW